MIRIQQEPFSVEEISRMLHRDGVGSVVTFTGIVRGSSRDGVPVTAVEWDIYPDMARRELETIRQEAMHNNDIIDATIVHRYGRQSVGEPLVLIAVASAHRKDGFVACASIMDEIKQRVPLWKKEIRGDGTSAWIEG